MRALAASLALLVLLPVAAGALPLDASVPALAASEKPESEPRALRMEFTGAAVLPRANLSGMQVTVEVDGVVDVRGNAGDGNGRSFWGDGLSARVRITRDDGNGGVQVAEEFEAVASIHGTFSPYLAQGLDGFRFNLETHGRAGPILAFGLHGNTTGTEEGDHLLAGAGHANVKHDDGAHNYRLDVTGSARLG